MNYLKICKKHGKLTQDKITKNRKGILICKKCRNEQSEDWREKNKEKQKLKCLKLRELAKENKLIKTCKIHGKLEGKDILVNNRASRMCGICQKKTRSGDRRTHGRTHQNQYRKRCPTTQRRKD